MRRTRRDLFRTLGIAVGLIAVARLAPPAVDDETDDDWMDDDEVVWGAVRLTRDNVATGIIGQYLMEPPNTSGPSTLWGRPVVLSTGLSEDTTLGAYLAAHPDIVDRQPVDFEWGGINPDFVRNMHTILAELRSARAVYRPAAVERLVIGGLP